MNVKKGVLLIIVIILNISVFSQAVEGPKTKPFKDEKEKSKDLKVSFDLTYTSKWLSKGVEAYGANGAIFETIDVDLYNTGFGIKTTHRSSTSSGHVDKQRFDFRPYYKSRFFKDKTFETNYNISVGYEYYYGLDRKDAGTTFEWIFYFSWPWSASPCSFFTVHSGKKNGVPRFSVRRMMTPAGTTRLINSRHTTGKNVERRFAVSIGSCI